MKNFLKRLIVIFTLLILSITCLAQVNPNKVWVNGYYRSNGTYVRGHWRTAPNHTNIDNYSTRGNVNPYTGKPGYISPDSYGLYKNTYRSNYSSYKPKVKLELKGEWGYTFSQKMDKLSIRGHRIVNSGVNGRSNKLKLSLYLCSNRYDNHSLSGYSFAEKDLSPLTSGYYYYDINYTKNIKMNIPNGIYHVVLVLTEYKNDGKYYIVDYMNFSNTITIYK
ncbi:MAG: hypothetical protein N4A32_03705 [Marinifilaceae bacterium]|jgi:hypothetical protein|nr:hypothetical protein [Marinifilaceae bacterium]